MQQRDEVQLRSSDQSRGVKKKKKTITWCQQLITGSIQNQTKTLKKITINRYKLQVIVTINLSYATVQFFSEYRISYHQYRISYHQ